jgi:hypothetical protein
MSGHIENARHIYCQDPIKKHKKRISKNLRKVTDLFVEKCNGKLRKGSLLCVNCWTMILKNPSVISPINSSKDNSDLSEDIESSSTVSMEVDSEHNSFDDDATPVLQLLNQTPIKKSEYE